jgi:DNA-binding SARP family transcriptional activator/tetratricopeptide (TPR) repeat protein
VGVRLLGPVDVTVAGLPRRVAGRRPKAALAVLALAAGEVVGTDQLIDVVWDGRPPATALNTLQRHMSYLRGVLDRRDAVVARASGYLLDDETDVQAAVRLIELAGRSADPVERLPHLRGALALWRGRPLADVSGLSWLDGEAERLTSLREDTVQAVIDARLELGEHAELVPELRELTRRHPYREQLHRQLMLALHRSGQPDAARAVFDGLARTLADELGIDPGPGIREVAAALGGSPSTVAAQMSTVDKSGPRQLPIDIAGFAGREHPLHELDALVRTGAAAVAAISGTAGAGKTALAVHWAHSVADRFPDGQLYVNLRGFDPVSAPMEPAEAVGGFLDALGVGADQMPQTLDAQVALYRSLTADRRILVVLDNAVDSAQVRPLLPASVVGAVVVTSRAVLTGLVAAEGAVPVNLDLLTTDEARELLQHRLGKDRVSAEAEAVDDVIERCAHLPLALAVVAAQAGTEPHRSLAALAAELRDSPSALEALTAGDPATDVAGVFSWSYRRLTPAAARLFRLLGLHPGPSVNVAAAASLAGLPVPRVRALLTELTQANLLTEHRLGRFSFHDLLCGYAAGQAQRLDSEAQRRFARQRLLDHFVHTVYAINLRLYPHRNPPAPPPPESGVTLPRLDSDAEALDWLIVERGVLVAAIEQAVALGFHQHTWHLAWNLQSFFNRRAQGPEWVATARAALAAAERLDDAHLRGQAHRNLALASGRVDRLDDAYTQLRLALALAVEVGDLAGQAHTLHHLGLTRQRQRRYAEAQEYAQQAIALYRETGHRRGEAHALNGYGWYSALLGQYEMALAACEEALALLEEFDDRQGYAHTLHSIGYAHQHLGHHEKAIEFYRSSIELHRRFGDRFGEAQSLTQLGDALREPDPVAARRAWEQALAILDDLHHPDAADVQGRLSRVDYP